MLNKTEKSANLPDVTRRLLSGLEKRQRDILEKRFGLFNGATMTLAAVGDQYSITRERVRQIEALALSAVKGKIKADPEAVKFIEAVENYLKKNGRLREEAALFSELKQVLNDAGSDKEFGSAARFILEASEQFGYGRDDEEWQTHWFVDKADQKKMKAFIVQLVKTFRSEKEAILESGRFDDFLATAVSAHDLPEAVGRHYLTVSKSFFKNRFNTIGLSEWPEVNPRTARDWAYVVLKKGKRPLHFIELASAIGTLRQDKRTNPQTVHNELIKDDRFVLVGRGIYGLKEFNLLPGTAREVLTHFLKNNGPLKAPEVVRLVLTQRIFKEGTLLINLQNKKYFKKLADGRYTLSEA